MDACRIPYSDYMHIRRRGVGCDEGASDGEDDTVIGCGACHCSDKCGVDHRSEISGHERLRRAIVLLLCSLWWSCVLVFLTLLLCFSIVFVFEWHFVVE